MPFLGQDWRSPGESWVKTEEGWIRTTADETNNNNNVSVDRSVTNHHDGVRDAERGTAT